MTNNQQLDVIPDLPGTAGAYVLWFSGMNTYRFTNQATGIWTVHRAGDTEWEGLLFRVGDFYGFEAPSVHGIGAGLDQIVTEFL